MAKFPVHLPRSRLEKPSQPALSYEHIENFTKDLGVRRDLGNRVSTVNRAHMKRPLVDCGRLNIRVHEYSRTPAVNSNSKGKRKQFEFKQGIRVIGVNFSEILIKEKQI